MSTRDLHEYVPGQFTQWTREFQQEAGADIKPILDMENVRMAGYAIELWDSSSGGVQLIQGTDYILELKDEEISGSEGFDVYAGYMIITPAFQTVPLYITAKIVGGYTFRPYRPQMKTISTDTVLTMDVIADMVVRVDTSAGDVTVTLPDLTTDGLAQNNQITILPLGDNVVIITHPTFIQDVRVSGTAAAFIYNSATWIQLGGSGGGSGGGMAVGEVAWWPGAGVPDRSKLVCDGALYNPADYPALFAKLGTLYGGDGVATFGVPNLSGITPGAFGSRDVNGRTKGDGTAIGGVREDQDQVITGTYIQRRFSGPSANMISPTAPFQSELVAATEYRISRESNVGDNEKITFNNALSARTGTYSRSTELVGRWVIQAYDTVQEVPADPSLVRDWVQKFLQETTPPATVVNAWGSGIFYVSIGYSFNGTPGRATMTLFVNPADGFNRYALASMDFTAGDSWIGSMYDAATNSFKPTSFGPDYTGLGVIAVFKWESVSLGTLNPPVDGWETVFDNPSNAAPVINAWGIGTYDFVIKTAVTGTSEETTSNYMYLDDLTKNRTSAGNTRGGSETEVCRATYLSASNTFEPFSAGVLSPAYIIKIRKFTGLLNVIHTYQATIEEVDTTAGDVAIVLPSAPAAGYQKTYVNIGTTGFKVTGLPDGIKLGGNKSLTVTWGGSRWSYEDVCIDSYKKTGTNSEEQRVEKYAIGWMKITCNFNTFATSRIFDFVESFSEVPIPISVTARHSAGLGAMQVVGDGYPTTTQIQVITGTGTAHDYTWQVLGRWD